jgi:hypothetical protein
MWDYERALEWLRRQAEETDRALDFLTLEARFRQNLDDEQLYGSTETRRAERAQIIEGLNRLGRDTLGISFNDLALGRLPSARLASGRVQALAVELGAGSIPANLQPPVTTKLQNLPFNELSWEQFETLCAALIEAQSHVLHVERYGVQGDFQKGIDIVAVQRSVHGREKWVYQCKRYKEYTARLLEEALEKVTYPTDFLVLMLSIEARVALRNVVANRRNTFLWDSHDLSRKLKNLPDIVEDFFGKAWLEAFYGSK